MYLLINININFSTWLNPRSKYIEHNNDSNTTLQMLVNKNKIPKCIAPAS